MTNCIDHWIAMTLSYMSFLYCDGLVWFLWRFCESPSVKTIYVLQEFPFSKRYPTIIPTCDLGVTIMMTFVFHWHIMIPITAEFISSVRPNHTIINDFLHCLSRHDGLRWVTIFLLFSMALYHNLGKCQVLGTLLVGLYAHFTIKVEHHHQLVHSVPRNILPKKT